MDGWVRLHRKFLKSRLFLNKDLSQVWIWCLLKASKESGVVVLDIGRGKTNVNIKAGQFICGRLRASRELGMSPSTLRNRLQILNKIGAIKIYPRKTYSIIYVAKWNIYQTVSIEDSIEIDGDAYERKVSWVRKK